MTILITKHNAAIVLQKYIRGYLARKNYNKLKQQRQRQHYFGDIDSTLSTITTSSSVEAPRDLTPSMIYKSTTTTLNIQELNNAENFSDTKTEISMYQCDIRYDFYADGRNPPNWFYSVMSRK